MEEEEVKLQGEVCCNSTPPLIYIGGCHPSSAGGMEFLQLELTLWTNDMFPRGWLRRWGPQAWSADQGGRPASPRPQPPPASGCVLSWLTLCPNKVQGPVLSPSDLVFGLLSDHLSLKTYSNYYSLKFAAILAQNHLHTFQTNICGIHY